MISDESSLIHVMPLHKDKEKIPKFRLEAIFDAIYTSDVWPGNLITGTSRWWLLQPFDELFAAKGKL